MNKIIFTLSLLPITALLPFGLPIHFVSAADPERKAIQQTAIQIGELSVLFQSNTNSPKSLSGVQSLFNRKHSPDYDAFDPLGRGSSAGLNFEHIISGHNDEANKFTPRHGSYQLYRLEDGKSVLLKRRHKDSPWDVSSTMKYAVKSPNYIDFEFRCVPHSAERFGNQGYAIFFWANYMNDVEQIALHFRGVNGPDQKEQWIAADAPSGHQDYRGGGTYGLAKNGMVMMLMFNKTYSEEDEIRFSLFKFKVKKDHQRPAWDYQYVIHTVKQDKEYGYRGRLVWKKFVSPDDCLQEYIRWSNSLK